MLSYFSFLRLYNDIAHERISKSDESSLTSLFLELKDRLPEEGLVNDEAVNIKKYFDVENPDRLDKVIAIDSVAHAFHGVQNGQQNLELIFPGANYQLVKSSLDNLAGMENTNEVRRVNRGFFSTLLSDDNLLILEKQDGVATLEKQVGRTVKEDIADAIEEYTRLFKAGIASPAEILTLHRYDPGNEEYKQAVLDKELDKEENQPMVVGGPASVEMIDKQGHLITVEALANAFTKFMANFRARNAMIIHSDVQCGWVLPIFINSKGDVYKSGVDDKGLWVITEIRNDSRIADKVKKEIEDKNIKSYSIAGSALKIANMQKGAQSYTEVSELELSEITLCLTDKVLIWTKQGIKSVKDVEIGDEVWTHQNRWRKVTQKFVREINEEIIRIQTEHGVLEVTKEHPIRTIVYGGQNIGTHYEWIEAGKLKVGDLVSSHTKYGNCDFCGAPLFKKLKIGQRNFCNDICQYSAVGNRKGKTLASGDKGAIAHSLKTKGRKGYYYPHSEKGKAIQRAAVTSDAFRKMRSIVQTEKCRDPEYLKNVNSKGGKQSVANRLERLGPEGFRQFMRDIMGKTLYRRGKFVSNEEIELQKLLNDKFPNQWKFVGDWQFNVGTKCPDFWNGGHKLIELFGDYWHKPQDEKEKVEYFKQYGYDCLILWTRELKKPNSIVEKVAEFSNNSLSKVISIERIPYSGFVYNLEVEEDNSYTTETAVVHNCERGVNTAAVFSILKSEDSIRNQLTTDKVPVTQEIPEPVAANKSSVDEIFACLSSIHYLFENPLVVIEEPVDYDDEPVVVIAADARNSVTDAIEVFLKKFLPPEVKIEVREHHFNSIPAVYLELEPHREMHDSDEELEDDFFEAPDNNDPYYATLPNEEKDFFAETPTQNNMEVITPEIIDEALEMLEPDEEEVDLDEISNLFLLQRWLSEKLKQNSS